MDLFNELLATTLDTLESYEKETHGASTLVCVPSLAFLHKIADFVTIDRALNKLSDERRRLKTIGGMDENNQM